jgi:two-component system cell cycle response regulator DivK
VSRRILVVDDVEANRHIRRDLLSGAGFEVIEAVTGEEAVTAHALSGDEVKARETRCDDHVTKPFRPRALLGTIRESLP